MNLKRMLIFGLMATLGFGQTEKDKDKNCVINKADKATVKKMNSNEKNVLGTTLQLASLDPITGFYRNGFCSTDKQDRGVHVIAAVVTKEFLEYSLSKGNDLISAYPASGFPGLKPGNVWCLCALRWKEAFEAGVAPSVILEATHKKALEFVTLEQLKSKKFED